MKNLNRIAILLLIGLLFGACGATNRLTMGAAEPARITIPSDVMKIGIINRSVPSEGNKTLDQIDKILSLEGLKMDKEGAEAAVAGVQDELTRFVRYESVDIIEDSKVQRKGLGVFPAALSWQDVDRICEENDVDLLISLEFYDTDTKADVAAEMVEVPNNFGIKAKVPHTRITLNTVIKNGWRVYYPPTKDILDEVASNNYVTSTGQGINPVKAMEAVVGRKEAVLQNSTYIGNLYGLDTRPKSRRVTRDYFVSGTDNFVVARRRAQAGDWQGAAQLWEQEVNNPKGKIAGRACYNMAIINEINGDLDAAIDWASRSYSDYGTNEALRYINILRNRVNDERRVDQQLSR
ncbi:DUF6340 family protein [Maribacter halichondriae]|uniref:DUF6340 family protein n=1 Tax=Maribacter halichondriae TaxID=2980554 RepID=UPI0023598A39|nr:DUF6340 family protein [Maribacter sp. Hal144]